MSENLTKLAQKIDFSKTENAEEGITTKELPETEEKPDVEVEKDLTHFQPPTWPWETVRSKLQ